MIHYKTKLATVRTSRLEDIKPIAKHMRIEDVEELWKSHNRTPEEALMIAFKDSTECLTVEKNGKPIAMFGVAPNSLSGDETTIWLVGTPKIEKVQRAFGKHSKDFIEKMLKIYPILSNYVDVTNKKTIKWLKWCGAKFGSAVPYGINGELFMRFEFRR